MEHCEAYEIGYCKGDNKICHCGGDRNKCDFIQRKGIKPTTIYIEPKVHEMTLEEIEKKLGYSVKIVSK